jgi:acyl transferase domain-containing protein
MTDDYNKMTAKSPDTLPKYAATGLEATMIANRVSYFFDVHGPSMHIDTACSSSMTALDLACKSLYNGRCSMVLLSEHMPTQLLNII